MILRYMHLKYSQKVVSAERVTQVPQDQAIDV